MIGTLRAFALDCPEPLVLAAFYAELIGGKIDAEDDEWVELVADHGTKLAFQRVEDFRAPAWPAQDIPQQAHIDIGVTDLDAAHIQVLTLGATLLEDWDGTKSWRVYADPVGHPFCLCAC